MTVVIGVLLYSRFKEEALATNIAAALGVAMPGYAPLS